jgi:ubiquitin carboxyl-terminal hydrolase 7
VRSVVLGKTKLLITIKAVKKLNDEETFSQDLYLFLDVLSESEGPHLSDNHDTIMIFLKHFDATKQEISGVGNLYVKPQMRIEQLSKLVYDKMGWPHTGCPHILLTFYEEIHPGRIDIMKPNSTFSQSEIINGDIICFQVEMDENV